MGSRLSTICRHFTSTITEAAGDAELLARFTSAHDEAAFAQLVKRHGPMVWSVCRNLLANAADADDAFQATFLALVRGAKAVRKPEALGAWLHGVAVRVANKLKRTAARRTLREKKVATNEAALPVADSQWDDVLAAVHEEVNRLPDGERTAFVVCCLEGVRQPEAAERLGWKPGTLTGRLSKAKQRLLDRLTSRGLAPAAALAALGLGATTTSAFVPAKLFDAVTAFAANATAVPASLLQLSQGVADMTITKVKLLAAAVLIAGGIASGIGASLFSNADAQSAPSGAATPPPARTPAVAEPTPAAIAPTLAAPVAGGAARGPSHRPWEYKFLDVGTMTTEQLKLALTKEGGDGWELTTIEHREVQRGTDHIAILKRPRTQAIAVSGLPLAGGLPGLTAPGGPGGAAAPAANNLPLRGFYDPATTSPNTILPPKDSLPTIATDRVSTTAPTSRKFTLHTMTPSHSPVVNVAKVLKELIAIEEFRGEVTAAIADEGSNTLLVKATEAGKKLVAERIQQLDEAALKKNLIERDRLEKGLKPKP